MTLNYVTLVLDLYDGQGNQEIKGSAELVPSAVLTNAGVAVTGQDPVPAVFRAAGPPSVKLLATDSSGPLPAGWTWAITFTGQAAPPAGFSFALPANPMTFTATNATPCVFTGSGSACPNGTGVQLSGGSLPAGFTAGTTYYVTAASGSAFQLAATAGGAALGSTSTGSGSVIAVQQFLSNLIPVSSGSAFQAYMPLPAGTPVAGQGPVATGAGQASAWGIASGSPSNPVTSAAAARPTGLTVVYWYCSSQPANWAAGDVWEQPPASSPPVISTTSPLTAATSGVAYSVTLAASNSPTSWAIAAGSVPGLSLSNSGVLSGTPTTPGSYSIAVVAANSAGATAVTLAITVGTGNAVPNGSFASDVSGWSGTNATLAWDGTHVPAGATGAMKITATATGSDAQAQNSAAFAVTASHVYASSAQVLAGANARTVYFNVNWLTSSFSFISTSNFGFAADNTSTWTSYSGNVTAPSNAAWASVTIGVQSPLVIGEAHYAALVSMV